MLLMFDVGKKGKKENNFLYTSLPVTLGNLIEGYLQGS